MTSVATRPFYYASLAERFDPAIWSRTWSWISGYVVGVGMLPVLAIGVWAAWRSQRPLFWSGLALASLLPVAIFYGGYYKHDYYWAALTPEVAAFVGMGVASLVDRAHTTPRRAVVVTALSLAALLSVASSYTYWSRAYPPLNDFEGVLPRARELAMQSRSDDQVLIVGRSYDPDLAYYARRRAMMLTIENQTDQLLRRLATEPYPILFSWDPSVDDIWVARYWPWNGVVSAHTYTLGNTPSELRAAPIMASDDVRTFDAVVRSGVRSLLAGPLVVPCDRAAYAVPAGSAGTWLRIRADGSTAARLSAATGFAPFAARQIVILAPLITFGQPIVSISCTGATGIVIEAVYDAPPPG